MDDAGGIAVPEHLVPALLAWFKNPKPIYGATHWWSTTYNEDRTMKQVYVDVRLDLGLMPDEVNLPVEAVLKLIRILPLEVMNPEPIRVAHKDIDTGLLILETVFDPKDTTKT